MALSRQRAADIVQLRERYRPDLCHILPLPSRSFGERMLCVLCCSSITIAYYLWTDWWLYRLYSLLVCWVLTLIPFCSWINSTHVPPLTCWRKPLYCVIGLRRDHAWMNHTYAWSLLITSFCKKSHNRTVGPYILISFYSPTFNRPFLATPKHRSFVWCYSGRVLELDQSMQKHAASVGGDLTPGRNAARMYGLRISESTKQCWWAGSIIFKNWSLFYSYNNLLFRLSSRPREPTTYIHHYIISRNQPLL